MQNETLTREEQLEAMIDRFSVYDVLNAIAKVCNEKAEQLRENWQDETAAKRWNTDARKIENCALKIHN